MKQPLYATLATYCNSLSAEFEQISDDRKATLRQLNSYIKGKHITQQSASLVVICTHNSRRSHLGQVWLQTAAACYGVDKLQTYSGGTEATAVHPNAVAALRHAGFGVQVTGVGPNPVYIVHAGADIPVASTYSKRYDDAANPARDFCAIMVCTDADRDCPIVFGSENRITLPYDDPKAYDGTSEEAEQYDRCCRRIAREMFYAMSVGRSHSAIS